MAETKKEEKQLDVQGWKTRKLKAINKMTNKAKAKAAAERVLNNK